MSVFARGKPSFSLDAKYSFATNLANVRTLKIYLCLSVTEIAFLASYKLNV